jgi:HPt (histidine-containing phosphotransfer) domain-containing protein
VDPEESSEAAFREHLAATWAERRPRLLARVDRIAELTSAGADSDERAEARGIAHQLAGLLGTIGLPAGSDCARRVEAGLERDQREAAAELGELRGLLEGFDGRG